MLAATPQPPADPSLRPLTSVAIPTLNAGTALDETLSAVARQRLTGGLELIVCDSGSTDGSPQRARDYGAIVIEIDRDEFSHGRTRNLLMSRARGDHVAFLTQDSVPADELWLSRLLAGFAEADDVAMTFGPYRPRSTTSPMVAHELTRWFESFSPDGSPIVDRLSARERQMPSRALLGRLGYFTDANGCLSRAAWERVPFRDVAYAEDHVLAHDMLRAGFAKTFVPAAAVVHAHDYHLIDRFRRSFDEARALDEIYDWRQPISPRVLARNLWGNVGADWRWFVRHSGATSSMAQLALLVRATLHHVATTTGAVLGSRARRLPRAAERWLSLEGRPG
jgi:glycosyltransferase involved in cell wall biosynthesis